MIQEKDMVIWLTETVKSYPQKLIVDAFSWNARDGVNWIAIDQKWKKTMGCHQSFYL
jgi:hypothetical protein